MNTPSGDLARKIIKRLVSEQLLTEQGGKQMVLKLSEGKVRSEDWRLAIELGDAKEAKV